MVLDVTFALSQQCILITSIDTQSHHICSGLCEKSRMLYLAISLRMINVPGYKFASFTLSHGGCLISALQESELNPTGQSLFTTF